MSLAEIVSAVGSDPRVKSLFTGSHLSAGNTVSVSVTGLAELERALNALPEALARGAMATAVKRGTEKFRDRAIELAPFDPDKKNKKHPMHLQDGIRQTFTMRSTSVAGTWLRGRVGLLPEVFYGRFLEKGFHAHDTAVAGIHWMQKAFEQAKYFALATFESEMRSGLEAAIAAVRRV